MSSTFRSSGTALIVLAMSIPAPGSAHENPAQQQADGRTVAAQANLVVIAGSSSQEKLLAVVKDAKNVGSIAVPPRVSATALDEGLKGILRHPNGKDLAVGFRGEKGSFVVVFLQQTGGTYLAVDVSQVERVNIGFIGPDRSYRDAHTVPTQWHPYQVDDSVRHLMGDDPVQVSLQTRAWDMSGQRYTVREPLIITRDGRPLWR